MINSEDFEFEDNFKFEKETLLDRLMPTVTAVAYTIFSLVTVLAFYFATASLPIWFLWNWLMPDLFALPSINLLQAFGLAWLGASLFKPTGII